MGTDKEQKIPPPQNPREKIKDLNFLIGCMKFLFPKLFATIFNLG
jgi:hypothetical protein